MICPDCETEVDHCQRCGADLRAPVDAHTSEVVTTVGAAQPGLLRLVYGGAVIMKTDYRVPVKAGSGHIGPCECYIVDGGEAYHGNGDSAKCVELRLEK